MPQKPNKIIINDNITMENSVVYNGYIFERVENSIKLIWNDDVTSSELLFDGCSNITEIDLSLFDASHANQMYNMFNGCKSLKSINFGNFDTSNAINMGHMFFGCSSLISLDLTSFRTQNVEYMDCMFTDCSSLNFSRFSISSQRKRAVGVSNDTN